METMSVLAEARMDDDVLPLGNRRASSGRPPADVTKRRGPRASNVTRHRSATRFVSELLVQEYRAGAAYMLAIDKRRGSGHLNPFILAL